MIRQQVSWTMTSGLGFLMGEADRVEAAVFEAGHPGIVVEQHGEEIALAVDMTDMAALAVVWKAGALVSGMNLHACWRCFLETAQGGNNKGTECQQGRCSNPGWRPGPPVELLRVRGEGYDERCVAGLAGRVSGSSGDADSPMGGE